MTEQEVMQGLSYLTLMSYNRIDKSELTEEQKRDLLYSMYCFRCVFDDEELKRASHILVSPKATALSTLPTATKKRTSSTFIRLRLR